jgi:hypothetical protein
VTPLVLLTLLAFGVVVVAALFVWTLLTPRPRPPAAGEAGEPRVRARSNDEVRGAKARGATERPAGEDAFERFLRAGRDESA